MPYNFTVLPQLESPQIEVQISEGEERRVEKNCCFFSHVDVTGVSPNSGLNREREKLGQSTKILGFMGTIFPPSYKNLFFAPSVKSLLT